MFHISHHGKSFSLQKSARAAGKEENPEEVEEEGALVLRGSNSGWSGGDGGKLPSNPCKPRVQFNY